MHLDRRAFLLTTAAVGAAAVSPGVAVAADAFSAETTRLPGGAGVDIGWSNAPGPVRVHASSDADAPVELMRVLAERARGASMKAPLAARPRPYFLLRAGASQTRTAERLLPLTGGRNFRDLGGYVGADGRQVRWGRIYRSGVMASLTAEDLSYLAALDIDTVCDFRSSGERKREPSAYEKVVGAVLAVTDYEMNYSDMGAMMAAKSREDAIIAFSDSYARFAVTLKPQFTDLFQRLVRDEAPLAFNCSAGKDRTGLASALILSVLGVSREDVVADYALSETYVPPDTYLDAMRGGTGPASLSASEQSFFSRMPEPVIRVLMGTPREVMLRTLARIDADHGGPIAFVKANYGVNDADIDRMRAISLYEAVAH
jgi:protein-tyrosine phosphatase